MKNPSNAREYPIHKVFAMDIPGKQLSKAQQSAAISLTGWMQCPTNTQIDVSNEEDFKAISEMMRSLHQPLNGISFRGRDVERFDGGLKPGKYTIIGQEKVHFTVYFPKTV